VGTIADYDCSSPSFLSKAERDDVALPNVPDLGDSPGGVATGGIWLTLSEYFR